VTVAGQLFNFYSSSFCSLRKAYDLSIPTRVFLAIEIVYSMANAQWKWKYLILISGPYWPSIELRRTVAGWKSSSSSLRRVFWFYLFNVLAFLVSMMLYKSVMFISERLAKSCPVHKFFYRIRFLKNKWCWHHVTVILWNLMLGGGVAKRSEVLH
jgi:hypothetical protein